MKNLIKLLILGIILIACIEFCPPEIPHVMMEIVRTIAEVIVHVR